MPAPPTIRIFACLSTMLIRIVWRVSCARLYDRHIFPLGYGYYIIHGPTIPETGNVSGHSQSEFGVATGLEICPAQKND